MHNRMDPVWTTRAATKRRRNAQRESLAAEPLETRMLLSGSISGSVFYDSNYNSVFDSPAEAGIPSRTVIISHSSAAPQPGDLSAVSDANGAFSFTNLADSLYYIWVANDTSLSQTTQHPFAVAVSGQALTGKNIGFITTAAVDGNGTLSIYAGSNLGVMTLSSAGGQITVASDFVATPNTVSYSFAASSVNSIVMNGLATAFASSHGAILSNAGNPTTVLNFSQLGLGGFTKSAPTSGLAPIQGAVNITGPASSASEVDVWENRRTKAATFNITAEQLTTTETPAVFTFHNTSVISITDTRTASLPPATFNVDFLALVDLNIVGNISDNVILAATSKNLDNLNSGSQYRSVTLVLDDQNGGFDHDTYQISPNKVTRSGMVGAILVGQCPLIINSGDFASTFTSVKANRATPMTINAGGGNDSIGTNDSAGVTVFGGDGNDTIAGANGNDSLAGSAGDDVIYGEEANDTISGGEGNDTEVGGTGADTYLFGDPILAQNDVVEEDASAGIDTLDFSAATLPVTVNLTHDTGMASVGSRAIRTLAGMSANFENVVGGSGADRITGNSADNVLSGGAGNDTITGGSGNDKLSGGDDNDRLLAADGFVDTVDGGDGDDTAIVDGAGSATPDGVSHIEHVS